MAKTIDGFKLAASVLEKSTIPILAAAYVKGGRVFATDLDIQITAPTDKPDAFYTKKGEPLAHSFPPEDVPYMSTVMPAYVLDLGDLPGMLSRVRPAVSTEETRYYLNGVFFEFLAYLQLTATDGHRLLSYDTPHKIAQPASGEKIPPFILPRKTVDMVLKAGGVQWVLAYTPDHRARFTNENGVTIESKLIDGAFPDYSRVIPKGPFAYTLTGEVKPCLDAAKTLAGYGSERSKSVKVTGRDLYMHPPEVAPLQMQWPVDVTLGMVSRRRLDAYGVPSWVEEQAEDVQPIGFNARYLREALEIPGKLGGTFTLAYADAASPARLSWSALPGLTGVMMPLRV